MLAASINPIDFKLKQGGLKMLLKYEMPLIMGNDEINHVNKNSEG